MFQKLVAYYRSLNYWGRVGAWGLGAAILAIILYFTYSMGTDNAQWAEEFPRVVVLEMGDKTHRVRLTSDIRGPVYDQYQPLSGEVRDQVVRQLGEFRAKYKQLWPAITIESNPDNRTVHQVAQTLAQMLARFNLGQLVAAGDLEDTGQPLTLWCSPDNIPVAYTFLSAIAPYIQGELILIKDPSYSAARMKLQLQDTPRFNQNGSVVFD